MSNYFDLLDENEELVFIPIINEAELIKNYINILDDENDYNFIFCDNINFDFINNVSKCANEKNINHSISLMKNYKILNWSGEYNYNNQFIVFHTGDNFEHDKHEMILRHFSTMSYLYTKITYATIQHNNFADYCIYS